jgi:hypothetical protein
MKRLRVFANTRHVERFTMPLLWLRREGPMSAARQRKRGTSVVKARKPKGKTEQTKTEHAWRVTRRGNEEVTVTAEGLTVMDGELVFSTNGVPVRIIAADTYTDVEILPAA